MILGSVGCVYIVKNVFYLVECFDDKVDTHKHAHIRKNYFCLISPQEEVWPGKTQLMSLTES